MQVIEQMVRQLRVTDINEPNYKYEYLLRIISAVQQALKEMR